MSYEDIFKRHSRRPVTYLDGHLSSPITRVPTPFFLRTPATYKKQRRPNSVALLDSMYTYKLREMPPEVLIEDYKPRPRRSSIDNTYVAPRLTTAKENFPRSYRSSYNLSSEDEPSRHYSSSYRVPSKEQESSSRVLHDTQRYPLKDHNTSTVQSDRHRYSSLERKPRNFSDNYRHAVTFQDKHLSRRERPLCTPDDLLDIIREPVGYYALPTDPWNEVYPDVYLSDAPTALCTTVLMRLGITHVLNAALGKEKGCGQVNTSPSFYSQSGIKFLGVPAFDNIVFRIYPYFEEAAQFIEDGLKDKGKVLVHCRAGISRSATLVCAFLMLKRGMSVQDAVRTVRKNREIIPNDGFLQQLCDLNDRLKKELKLR